MAEKDTNDAKMISVRLPESLHTRVKSAAPLRGTNVEGAYQQALSLWLSWPELLIAFSCEYCRAEYAIPAADPTHPAIKKAPVSTSTPSEVPQVNPGIQWMLDELVLLLQDPDEKSTIRMLSGYLAERRQSRGE